MLHKTIQPKIWSGNLLPPRTKGYIVEILGICHKTHVLQVLLWITHILAAKSANTKKNFFKVQIKKNNRHSHNNTSPVLQSSLYSLYTKIPTLTCFFFRCFILQITMT